MNLLIHGNHVEVTPALRAYVAGKLNRVAVAKALHGLKIRAAKQPGVLMDVAIDDAGDLDRASFIVQVKDGKQEVKEVLPPLAKF